MSATIRDNRELMGVPKIWLYVCPSKLRKVEFNTSLITLIKSYFEMKVSPKIQSHFFSMIFIAKSGSI